MGRPSNEDKKRRELQEKLSEDLWWSPELEPYSQERADSVVEAADSVRRAQRGRTENILIDYSMYLGQDMVFAETGGRVSISSFLPPADGSLSLMFPDGVVKNVTAACVEDAVNRIASRQPKPQFVTEGGDGMIDQQALTMERLVRGVFRDQDVPTKSKRALRWAAVGGTGALKVVEADRVRVEAVALPELYVDDHEAFYGEPRTLYQVPIGGVRRDVLAGLYPEAADFILDAELLSSRTSTGGEKTDKVEVYEAWRLPSLLGAGDGRHVICVRGGVLLDEEWTDECFPFVFMDWRPPLVGFWGTGIPRIGLRKQLEINDFLAEVLRAFRAHGRPKLLINDSSRSSEGVKIPGVDVVRTRKDWAARLEFPPALQGMAGSFESMIASFEKDFYRETGVDKIDQPPERTYLQGGEAIRAWDEQVSVRFAEVVSSWERMRCDLAERVVEAGKRIAKREGSYVVKVGSGTFARTLDFKDVPDDLDYEVFCLPMGSLPTTYSGRQERLREMLERGDIDERTYRANLELADVQALVDRKSAPMDILRLEFDRSMKDLTPLPREQTDDLQSGVGLYTELHAQMRVLGFELEDEKRSRLERQLQLIDDWLDWAKGELQPPAPTPQSPQEDPPAADLGTPPPAGDVPQGASGGPAGMAGAMPPEAVPSN